MKAILKEIFLPEKLDSVMGRILGALSIVALLVHTFKFGLSGSFDTFFHYYDKLITLLLGWSEPYLLPLVNAISNVIDVHIKLSSSWRHVFVVLLILFVRDAGVAFSDRRWRTACVRMSVGLVIAVFSSVLATAEIVRPSKILWNLQIAVVPYIGIYFYDLVMYINAALFASSDKIANIPGAPIMAWQREIFKSGFVRASCRLAIVLAVIVFSLGVPGIAAMSYPKGGLLILGIATIANAAYWVYRGLKHVQEIRTQDPTQSGASWLVLFKTSEAGRFALAVVSVFVWSATFVIINAGFGILGL